MKNKKNQIQFVIGNQPYKYDPMRDAQIMDEILYGQEESDIAFREEIKRLSKK